MTLTIELTPEQEARLRQEATRQGLETEEYARRLFTNVLSLQVTQEEFRWEVASPQERVDAFRAMIDSIAKFNAPSISLEALRRENMYAERGR